MALHFSPLSLKSTLISTALVFAGTIGAFVAAPQIAKAFGVGVEPSTVEMTIKPGDRQRQRVTIGNVHKTKTISLTIGLADYTFDKDGQIVLSAPGETERSAADWVRFSPASVTLKPETKQDIMVEINAPVKVANSGDHRFALLATTMLPELDARGDISGVWNKYQLASLFYLTMMPSESAPRVQSVAVNPKDSSALTISIVNEGDAHARLKGNAMIKDASGEVVAETPLSAVVLDGGERDYKLQLVGLDALKQGEDYTIDFDMRNVFVPQNQFRAQPVEIAPLPYRLP